MLLVQKVLMCIIPKGYMPFSMAFCAAGRCYPNETVKSPAPVFHSKFEEEKAAKNIKL